MPQSSASSLSLICLLVATLGACAPSQPEAAPHEESTAEAPAEAPVTVRSVSQEEALAIGGGEGTAMLLDVRSADEFAGGHVPGAINISIGELADRLAELESARDNEIIVYCERGGRAKSATDLLEEAGFTKLGHLEGDMSAWRAAGLASE